MGSAIVSASTIWFALALPASLAGAPRTPTPETGRHAATAETPVVNRAAPGQPDVRPARDRWSRIYVPDMSAAAALRGALDHAFELLGDPGCQRVVDDFRDANDRPLRERLAALETDAQQYLHLIVFVAGTPERCRGRFAYTIRGGRVVFVCPRTIKRLWNDRRLMTWLVIHEMLHTLGLGEDPPGAQAITSHVRRHCRS